MNDYKQPSQVLAHEIKNFLPVTIQVVNQAQPVLAPLQDAIKSLPAKTSVLYICLNDTLIPANIHLKILIQELYLSHHTNKFLLPATERGDLIT